MNYRCGMGEAAPCRGGQHQGFLFGWGKGSAGLELPAGVGFRIGSETSMQYLVVQVRLSPPPPLQQTAAPTQPYPSTHI